MKIGFLSEKSAYGFFPTLSKMLVRKGHEISCFLHAASGKNFAGALNYVSMNSDALVYYGDRQTLFNALKSEYEVDETQSAFELNDTLYIVMDEFSEDFISEHVVPTLNAKSKTLYTTAIYKTIGNTEEQIKERLKNQIKNKSRMAFAFYPSSDECEVDVRYSSQTARDNVESILRGVDHALADVTYSRGDSTLAEQVFRLLKSQGKTLSCAESFTGGKIASEITLIPGASEVFKECVVAYSNEAKTRLLGVKEATIAEKGAVGAETAYEMASGVFMKSGCDVCIATTGNAGPTAEKEGEQGVCFIAVGDAKEIRVFHHKFAGDRKQVTESGVRYALYHLYRLLKTSRESADQNRI